MPNSERYREILGLCAMLRESFECYQISREGLEDPGLNSFVLTLVCYLTDDSLIFLTVYFQEEHEHFQCSSQQLASPFPKSQITGISLNLSVYSIYKQRLRGPPWEADV